MNETPSTDHIPYPTLHMDGLFSRLRAELALLRELIRQRPITITVPMNGMTHECMFETVYGMFAYNDAALAFFLEYPTRRLSLLLIKAAAEASTAVGWFAQNPPIAPQTAEPDMEYVAACERIQTDIADWRLSVDLKRTSCDLDVATPETVH